MYIKHISYMYAYLFLYIYVLVHITLFLILIYTFFLPIRTYTGKSPAYKRPSKYTSKS